MSFKFVRLVKYGVAGGAALIGSTVAAAKVRDGDYNSLALVRLTRTAVTAIDIGFTYRSLLYSKSWDPKSKEFEEAKRTAHEIGAEKLLELCRTNKGVYIKVGQHVGALDYLLPNEYVKTMRILHKDAPQNEVEDLYQVIREDLKKEPLELFIQFEPEPLGTASLAQVHKAKLKDGTDVAVKVQHRFVKENIKLDLIWMEFIIKQMSKIFPDFQMDWLVEETKKNIAKELDFMEEGRNAEKVNKMFSHYKWLKVPKIFWEYCTSRVLVMEYVFGGQVNDTKYIDEHKINREDLCKKLGDLYSNMIFITGFVHADPHPGNILVGKNPGDKEVTVYLLDHGLYAQLTDQFRYHYSNLWLSIISKDRSKMQKHAMALGIRKELYGLFSCIVTGRPWESILQGIDKPKNNEEEKNIFQAHLSNLMPDITECLQKVDRQALLVFKTNDLIRSIEYALGLQEKMVGFTIMTKYCIESDYLYNYKTSSSVVKKQYLNLKYYWTLLILYFYSIYFNYRRNFNI